ncbi:type I methionyl aminopeptidase [Candidatus Kuenenbacteria bacterium]|nr:type I methionyl aminopeptidase [Candidatus Kuenenbacteria bacterium]
MIRLKSEQEIKLLKQGGKILAEVLEVVKKNVKPGITTRELDKIAEDLILTKGGQPSFKNYGDKNNPYPATLCTSLNEEIVHGVPRDYILKEGDILGLDIGMRYPKDSGLYTDMAVTVPVGSISASAKNLIKVTKKALDVWLKNIKAGEDLYQLSKKVQDYIESNGYSVIRDLVGHGVGHAVHEDPQIPNYYIPGATLILKEGMVLALEPMVSSGDFRIKTMPDGWTAVTIDGSLTAHFEHSVVVTKRGCDVLTK